MAAADGRVALKVAGALSGVVFVGSLESSVGELRAEVARLLGGTDAKLIVGGRTLQDDTKTLTQSNITCSSRILVAGRGADAAGSVAQEAARQASLERIKRVMATFAARDSRTSDSELTLELENQDGSRFQLSDADRRAVVMGLALHDMGKVSMAQEAWPDAIDRLVAAEESLSCVSDPELLKGIDNLGLLLLDIVWCYYKLNDVSRLGVARERLTRARAALSHAHGPHMERVRKMHGSHFTPELAVYVRLELLEAVVAYHTGDLATAESSLSSASAKLDALQVPDVPLALLREMGYSLEEATRGLRFAGGDMDAALTFITQQRAAGKEREARTRLDTAWRKERKQYGRTAGGQYVEREPHVRLVDMGYDRLVAAEALRACGNKFNDALDTLMDANKRAALNLAVSLKQAMPPEPKPAKKAKKTLEAAASPTTAQDQAEGPSTSAQGAAGTSGPTDMLTDEQLAVQAQQQEEEDAAARLQAEEYGATEREGEEEEEEEGAPSYKQKTASDEEMENEVRAALQTDPMAAYDIQVEDEAEMIQLFTALCAEARARGRA